MVSLAEEPAGWQERGALCTLRWPCAQVGAAPLARRARWRGAPRPQAAGPRPRRPLPAGPTPPHTRPHTQTHTHTPLNTHTHCHAPRNPQAPPDQGCASYGLTLGAAMAAASVPVGFFRAHADLKHLTIQEKLVRMNSFRVAGRAMAGPMATFAAAGAAYAGEAAARPRAGRGPRGVSGAPRVAGCWFVQQARARWGPVPRQPAAWRPARGHQHPPSSQTIVPLTAAPAPHRHPPNPTQWPTA